MVTETGYKQITINSFQSGSIISDISLGFTEKKTASALETKLIESAKINPNLKIIKISVSDPTSVVSTSENTSENNTWWIPLVIVLPLFILSSLFILCLTALILKKRKQKVIFVLNLMDFNLIKILKFLKKFKRDKINKNILEESEPKPNSQTLSSRFNGLTTYDDIEQNPIQNYIMSMQKTVETNFRNQDPSYRLNEPTQPNQVTFSTPVKKWTDLDLTFESDDSLDSTSS